VAATATGLAWVPLPVAHTSRPATSIHWIGPILTGCAALCLLVLGVWLDVPVTRSLGSAALVMAASMLAPLEPLDGGHIAKGPAGLAPSLGLLGAALLLLLGVG
jgi:cellulose synthase operon protein C